MPHFARHNRYLNTVEMRQRKRVLASRPYSIQLEVTTKCNLACIMCARDKYHGRGENLTDDILEPVLRDLFPYCQDVIVSSFGEPLLYPRFKDIIARIDPESGLELGFFTNLLLLTEEMAEELVHSGVGYMNVSIDGATKETYEKIRAGGKWETLIEKLDMWNAVKKRLGAERPVMNLCVVGSTLNIDEAALFVDFAHRHGFDSVKYNPNMYVDDEEMDYLSLVHEQERTVEKFAEGYQRALELDMHTNYHQKPFVVDARHSAAKSRGSDVPATQLLANRLKRMWRTSIGWRAENTWKQSGGDGKSFFFLAARKAGNYAVDHIPGISLVRKKAPYPHVIPNDAPPKTCGNPWTHVHVKSDGLVYPCCFSDEVMGDLRKESFEDIWNGEKYQDLRDSLSRGKPWASCRRASCNWVETAASSDYGCTIDPLADVNSFPATEGCEVPVRITNTGRFLWLPPLHKKKPVKEFISLAYRMFSPTNELIDEGGHIPIPHKVKPGESIEMTLPVRGVAYAGKVKLKIDLVQEGVTWFGERGNNAWEGEVQLRDVPFAAYLAPWNKIAVNRALDRVLQPGQWVELPIRVTNVGDGPLSTANGDALSYHWRVPGEDYSEWEGHRVDLGEEPLLPGEHRDLVLNVEVPKHLRTARYELEIDMVREGSAWLSTEWKRVMLAWPVRVAKSTEEAASLPTHDARGKLHTFEPHGQCVTNTGNKGIW